MESNFNIPIPYFHPVLSLAAVLSDFKGEFKQIEILSLRVRAGGGDLIAGRKGNLKFKFPAANRRCVLKPKGKISIQDTEKLFSI